MRELAIGALRDGDEGTVEGTIGAAGVLVDDPDGTPCVYWERRRALDDRALEQGGERFWVQSGDDRVLVEVAQLLEVRARADWREAIEKVATSEIAAVSAELSRLKDVLRARDDGDLRRQQRKLKKVATLLCALKAQTRGKVHGGGSLEGQAKWIEKNRHLADDGPGKATIERVARALVVALVPGDPVTVSGRFAVEPMPPGLGAGGGYRDRPTCFAVHGATVVGRGEASEAQTSPNPGAITPEEVAAMRPRADPRTRRRQVVAFLAFVAFVAGVWCSSR